MSSSRLIVCEKTGRWAIALRRELAAIHFAERNGCLASRPIRVYETRSLPDCWEALAAAPASWLVLEATPTNLETLVERLASVGRTFPKACAMVCGERSLAEFEWLLRETGALQAVFSPRELGSAARQSARHLAAAVPDQRSLRERVWESLPWGR